MCADIASSRKRKDYDGMDRYVKFSKLGEGTYGVVYLAKDKQTSDMVALKKMRIDDDDEGIPSTAIREVSMLQSLSGLPHIVPVRQVIYENGQLYIVLQLMTGNDLKKRITMAADVQEPLDSSMIRTWMFQLLTAMNVCHSRGIMHRDLKPENLLLDDKNVLYMADFGLARNFIATDCAYTHEVTTLWYRAPEILLGAKEYTQAMDMWSIGVIFGELWFGTPLFPSDSEIDQLFRTFRLLGTPTEDVWSGVTALADFKMTFPKWPHRPLDKVIRRLREDAQALDLLTRLLRYAPDQRLSAYEALQHPYFDCLRTPRLSVQTSLQSNTVQKNNEPQNQNNQKHDLPTPSLASVITQNMSSEALTTMGQTCVTLASETKTLEQPVLVLANSIPHVMQDKLTKSSPDVLTTSVPDSPSRHTRLSGDLGYITLALADEN